MQRRGLTSGQKVGAPGVLDLIILWPVLRAGAPRAKWRMEFREREFGISHEGEFQVSVARLRETAEKEDSHRAEEYLVGWGRE